MKSIKKMIEGISFAPVQKIPSLPEGTQAESALLDALEKAKIGYDTESGSDGGMRFVIADLVVRVKGEPSQGEFSIDVDSIRDIANGDEVIDLSEERVMKQMGLVIRQIKERGI